MQPLERKERKDQTERPQKYSSARGSVQCLRPLPATHLPLISCHHVRRRSATNRVQMQENGIQQAKERTGTTAREGNEIRKQQEVSDNAK